MSLRETVAVFAFLRNDECSSGPAHLEKRLLRPVRWERQGHMEQILKIEDHVAIPPMM